MISILCAISLLILFLPFASVSANVQMTEFSAVSSQSVNGFTVATEGFRGYFLLVGPIVLIAMNYIKQLGKYKGLLAIIIPIICVISCIASFMLVKNVGLTALGYSDAAASSINIKAHVGIGFILVMLSYIATLVAGAVVYHDFTLDKSGLKKLKTEAVGFVQSAQGKVTQTAQTASDQAPSTNDKVDMESGPLPSRPQQKRSANLNKTEDILALIEKLSNMKEAGILTNEEFETKKTQLLGEI